MRLVAAEAGFFFPGLVTDFAEDMVCNSPSLQDSTV